ncbi:hypothetical protein EK21DRAFT_84121 [Setomelanomma holmii]|uniref:Uncharacterized protein n=1 Tax=Setomelanomma holmii TaxID=210430 RepID=A0A9P4HI78_9PLEO|nr:hypothetical protein EK21DRAFT_84121 [Setomelanomma holmii]
MRYSFALLAGVAAAVPQYSVNPISQISDGQIQAPPATSVVVVPSPAPVKVSSVYVAPSVSVPAVSLPSVISSVPVVIVPSATPVAPTSIVTPIVSVPGNTTVPLSTGASASRSPSGPKASSTATGTGVPQSTGAAGANLVSLGGLVLAVGAAVFA